MWGYEFLTRNAIKSFIKICSIIKIYKEKKETLSSNFESVNDFVKDLKRRNTMELVFVVWQTEDCEERLLILFFKPFSIFWKLAVTSIKIATFFTIPQFKNSLRGCFGFFFFNPNYFQYNHALKLVNFFHVKLVIKCVYLLNKVRKFVL